MIDDRMKNYWGAVRGMRRAPDAQSRADWLKGPFQLAITLEKDPRLRALLANIHQENNQPA
ncbi:hypothetical protein [Mesorhizobium sp. M7A.F.Ca.MR.362.00.0.0]|uniref:hypothetical protein n=1 Tax=Mesorhizobium sp. M7A.F.Ca.MR.362.00.0.0 TaxID=2496779 RepID=UPI000FD21F92|nr:hypothetical protein [Mesorhizobium sp. M7A.F.Ca.MR.362.00.0.0]RUU79737.1 hypothetical protein EOC06_14875 [Mesorhizobium sp. M7A.F.Ca.MR.362.00.0.0]RWN95496.1 MAG: hypothetical protein EOS05_11930 [Mesorhizobium sp.]